MPTVAVGDHRRAAISQRSVTVTASPEPARLEQPRPNPDRGRVSLVAGCMTTVAGGAGVVIGLLALSHRLGAAHVGWLLPLAGVYLAVSPTGGLFMVMTGVVAIAAGIFSLGYHARSPGAPVPVLAVPVFVTAMLAVLAAGSVATFLVAWELMALTSLAAILSDHHRKEVRDSGRWYAAVTHLGFLAILVGLVVLAASGRSDTLVTLASESGRLSSATRNGVFVLTLIGFGSKAGLLPLHAWLPRAHPEAPSPVSALMSATMVGIGVYGLIRVDLQILGPGPRWWALLLLGSGGVSAVYGVLQASVTSDLKRLLAYSTTENMGIVAVGLGSAMLLADYGHPTVAAVALAAAVLHTVAHAAFKTLTFLGAGSVLNGTGERDLDQLGGQATRMPTTTTLFAVGALGASGLPLGAGFVSEWLLLQSLIHSRPGAGTLVAVVMPVTVGMMALTTGVGILTMVKAFGIGFLARPRSAGAAGSVESPPSMLIGMALAAGACGLLAVAPAVLTRPLDAVVSATPQVSSKGSPHLGVLLRLPGIVGSVSPAWLALAMLVATGVVTTITSLAGRSRRQDARDTALWTCGAGPLTTRMEYTATSFAEPLQRVFDAVLRPEVDVEVTHVGESRYLVERVRYRSVIQDAVEVRFYRPVLSAIETWAGWVRRAHSGRVHLYVAYGAAGVTVVLVLAR